MTLSKNKTLSQMNIVLVVMEVATVLAMVGVQAAPAIAKEVAAVLAVEGV